MTPLRLLLSAIVPALSELASGGIPDSPQARCFLLAIALQESGLTNRRQVGTGGVENGPAMSWWQFEKGGGCRGVLTHRLAADHMRFICNAYNVGQTEGELWQAMQFQDIVAAAAARLLIYTLPHKLPETADTAWLQYISAWRPGKPHWTPGNPPPQRWMDAWAIAERLTKGA